MVSLGLKCMFRWRVYSVRYSVTRRAGRYLTPKRNSSSAVPQFNYPGQRTVRGWSGTNLESISLIMAFVSMGLRWSDVDYPLLFRVASSSLNPILTCSIQSSMLSGKPISLALLALISSERSCRTPSARPCCRKNSLLACESIT